MRSLRSSLATENLGSSSSVRGVRQSGAVTSYNSAPRHRLNLVDAQVSGALSTIMHI